MNSSILKVEGYRYLRQRGGSLEVRLQVPKRLRPIVGKGELKKSLGGDLGNAKRNYHRTVTELQNVIAAAEVEFGGKTGSKLWHDRRPTQEQIDDACYAYFKQMLKSLSAIPSRLSNSTQSSPAGQAAQ